MSGYGCRAAPLRSSPDGSPPPAISSSSITAAAISRETTRFRSTSPNFRCGPALCRFSEDYRRLDASATRRRTPGVAALSSIACWDRRLRAPTRPILANSPISSNQARDRIGALDFQASATELRPPRSRDGVAGRLALGSVDRVERGVPLDPMLDAALFHGSSIGGARPKATIASKDKRYIAKFSLRSDVYDVVKAEFVAHAAFR